MLLVFDVGNTNMVLGLYKGKELIRYWRITTDKYKTSDEYGILISNLFQHEKPGIKTGLNIKYDNPKQVGADRIVNAVACVEKYGTPVIVVDFGTATTFCAITNNADYLGGTIVPGLKISSEALFQRASKLPRVELVKPGSVICKNTVSAMQAGIIYGYVGSVEKIIEMMKRELNQENVKVIATGGLSTLIASETKSIDHVDRFLTLDGLRILHEKNKE